MNQIMNGVETRKTSTTMNCAVLVSLIAVPLGFGSSACSKKQEATTVLEAESTETEVAPSFGKVPDLLDTDSRSCDLTEAVTDADSFVAAVGKTPEQIASDVDINFESMLRWETLVPPFDNLESEESVTISLEYAGSGRLYARCDNLVELDFELRVNSQSGALAVRSPATLSYTPPDGYRVRATLPTTEVSKWTEELRSITLHAPTEFVLELNIGELGAGGFFVNGPGSATCQLARWPAQRLCPANERAVLSTEAFLGLRTEHVLQRVRMESPTHAIKWDDTGISANITINFIPDESGLACVSPAGVDVEQQPQFKYSVLGAAHLTTDDGRVDITLPSYARTRGKEGAWSDVEVFSIPSVAPEGVLPGADGLRPIVTFSAPREPITATSTRPQGGLDVEFVELVSPRANPASSSCIAGNFMGPVSPAITASYVARKP